MAACGAKTRAGSTCKNGGMTNGRCRMHGGKSPKTNKNAVKHGIYSKGFHESELEIVEQAKEATLKDELIVLRVSLARAFKAKGEVLFGAQDSIKKHFMPDTIKQRKTVDGVGKDASVTRNDTENITKMPDFDAIIDRITGRINSIERTLMLGNADTGGDREIVGFEFYEYPE